MGTETIPCILAWNGMGRPHKMAISGPSLESAQQIYPDTWPTLSLALIMIRPTESKLRVFVARAILLVSQDPLTLGNWGANKVFSFVFAKFILLHKSKCSVDKPRLTFSVVKQHSSDNLWSVLGFLNFFHSAQVSLLL